MHIAPLLYFWCIIEVEDINSVAQWCLFPFVLRQQQQKKSIRIIVLVTVE